MEALEHPSPIAALINALLSPLGVHAPDHLIFCGLIALFILVLGLAIRSQLSIERPGTLQIILEDTVSFFVSVLEANLGHQGRAFLPLLGTIFVFIWLGNMMGQIPGLGAPTSNINVPFACALTVVIYYHFHGVRTKGILSYIKHFAVIPGVPIVLAPMIFLIEIISHLSRVLSLTLRLFGNIFGEHVVVLIIAGIVPLIAPLPIQFLGLIVGTLQAFIFMTLAAIYLSAAVAVDEHH